MGFFYIRNNIYICQAYFLPYFTEVDCNSYMHDRYLRNPTHDLRFFNLHRILFNSSSYRLINILLIIDMFCFLLLSTLHIDYFLIDRNYNSIDITNSTNLYGLISDFHVHCNHHANLHTDNCMAASLV